MARAIADIERDIRALSPDERRQLLRALISDLDAPADKNVEKAWLAEVQRRYRDLVEGTVATVPGHLVFKRLRSRLGG